MRLPPLRFRGGDGGEADDGAPRGPRHLRLVLGVRSRPRRRRPVQGLAGCGVPNTLLVSSISQWRDVLGVHPSGDATVDGYRVSLSRG